MTIEWRPVVGWDELYEVSSDGAVRRIKTGRILRPRATGSPGNPYYAVALWRRGHRKDRKVHHLVAEAFIGPRPHGHEINHIDLNKLRNVVVNLEWVTHRDNMRHAGALGRMNRHVKVAL